MNTIMTLAGLVVAIPLALSVVNAEAQQADDLQPRLGETRREYERRLDYAARHLEEG